MTAEKKELASEDAKEYVPEIIKPIRYSDLFRYTTTIEFIFMAIALFFSIAAGAALPATSLVFGGLVDTFAKWQAQPAIGVLITADQLVAEVNEQIIFFFYLFLIALISTYAYMGVFVYTSEAAAQRIRKQYLSSVMRQNIGWFDKVGPGEVATRITSDTLLIQDGIGEKLPMAFTSAATFISGFAVAFTKSWKMTLVMMSVVPLIIISVAVMNLVSGRFQTRILSLYSSAGNIAEESISAVRTVTAFNSQKKVSNLYNNSLAGARSEGIKKSITTGTGLGFLMFFIYCSYAIAFWYGHILLQDNEITVGNVVNVFFAVLIGAFSLGQIAPDLQAFAFAIGAGTKIFETIDRIPEIDPQSEDGERLSRETLEGHIELRDVEFTYPSRPDIQVLKKMNLIIHPGSTVALVGQSGSGKSTIVQLLERFYDVDSGSVLIDGKPIKSLHIKTLRQMIGLVSQEPTLFEGTVAENVGFGLVGSAFEKEIGEKRQALIEDACKQANAHDFIMKLPQGYDTQVGEGGLLLSGGQKQRIAIARAIIKDPKILLLDEATSALDTTSERVVQEALDRVSKSRTTISIAHRLSTIRNADNIVVMVRGEIVEQGNHDKLVKQDGLYAKLVNAQTLETGSTNSSQKSEDDPDEIIDQVVHEKEVEEEDVGTDDLETGKEKKMSSIAVFGQIMKFNAPELKYTIPALIASIGSGLINPYFAVAFAEIINAFATKGEELESNAKYWSTVFLLIATAAFILGFLQNALFGLASELLTERLRKMVFVGLMRQDIGFFDDEKNSTGSLTSNLSSDAQKVQGASGATLGAILQVLANLIASIVISFVYGWKLAAVATACLPILVLTSVFRLAIFTYFSDKSKAAYERSSQVACESVSAIKTVQSLTRENAVYDAYAAQLVGPLNDGFRSAVFNTPLYALAQSINFLINGLIFWYGGHLLAYEGYTNKEFFTVFVAIVFGSQSIGRVFSFMPDLAKAKESGESIIKLLDRKPRIDSDSTEGKKIENIEGLLKFNNVKFSYPTRPDIQVLKGLEFEVKPGQFAALVGPSGCGKSTTIGLIERFYDISAGKITIDGNDISSLNVRDYRHAVGLVSQEPNLFDMTIKENIAFGLDYIPSQEEIEEACKSANIHDFIMSQPDQYLTRVGIKGGQLSGGQKQRIAIARALIKKPKILLLDEATSALDAESEKVVQEALDKASKGRTTLSIAHRLSTIQHADVIYVLKDGVVAEKGTHSELYQLGGIYYELAVQQDLTVE
ncbi:ATP-binding cassette transporter ABC4 [Globomyces pollinis-pini]|nr:ATP-binding cassette transporter ABC4 [Globomyces pollinis-pini]